MIGENCAIEKDLQKMVENLLEDWDSGDEVKNLDSDGENNLNQNKLRTNRAYSQKVHTQDFSDQKYIEMVWQPINLSSQNIHQVSQALQDTPKEDADEEHHPTIQRHRTAETDSFPNIKFEISEKKKSHRNNIALKPLADTNNGIVECLKNCVGKSKKIDQSSFDILKGNFYSILTCQNGSRILQDALNRSSTEILDQIFEEIEPQFQELVVQPYANYFIQRFFEVMDDKHKIVFLTKIKDGMVAIANNQKGTFFLQKIFEAFDKEKFDEGQQVIVEAVLPNILDIIRNEYGCHVIEKIIEQFNQNLLSGLIDVILEKFLILANHSHGLCVVKKIIGYITIPEVQDKIQALITENFSQLVQHSSGNYTIQEIIDKWEPGPRRSAIINLFQNQYHFYSMLKSSSNVVEKCFQKEENTIKLFADEVCHKTKLLELMKSQYGNYVVRKALELAKGYVKSKLMYHVKKNIAKLTDQKLIDKWKITVEENTREKLCIENSNNNNTRKGQNSSVDSHHSDGSFSVSSSINSSPQSQKSNHSNHSNRSNKSSKCGKNVQSPKFDDMSQQQSCCLGLENLNLDNNLPGILQQDNVNTINVDLLRKPKKQKKNNITRSDTGGGSGGMLLGAKPQLSPKMEAEMLKQREFGKVSPMRMGFNVNMCVNPPIVSNVNEYSQIRLNLVQDETKDMTQIGNINNMNNTMTGMSNMSNVNRYPNIITVQSPTFQDNRMAQMMSPNAGFNSVNTMTQYCQAQMPLMSPMFPMNQMYQMNMQMNQKKVQYPLPKKKI